MNLKKTQKIRQKNLQRMNIMMKGIKMKVEIGDKLTLFNGEEYRVVNILKYNNKDFMYLLNMKDPNNSWIYEYRDVNGKMQVKKEKDEKIVEEILELIKSEIEE